MKRDLTEFENAPWSSVTDQELEQARQVPTMLSEDEQKLYYWLTKHWTEDAGAVVDLGCFIGGSTARLSAGLADAGKKAEVHAYDRFRASKHIRETVLYRQGVPPFNRTNILPHAIEYLEPWTDRIELHPGEIEEQEWHGGPIELLVMDASKSTESMDRMAEIFFPHLIPGRSLVIQQDYLNWKQPWVPAQMRQMWRWFRPVAYCPKDTVIFHCAHPVGQKALDAGRITGISDLQLQRAVRHAQRQMVQWGLTHRMRAMRRALQANPGVRRAVKMEKPQG